MDNEKVFAMPFAKVYPLLVQKVVRKGKTQEELDDIIEWLTGYHPADLRRMEQEGTTYGDFFRQAPRFESAAQAHQRKNLRHPRRRDHRSVNARNPLFGQVSR